MMPGDGGSTGSYSRNNSLKASQHKGLALSPPEHPKRSGGSLAWATEHRPATPPPAPIDERLSLLVDQFSGSGQAVCAATQCGRCSYSVRTGRGRPCRW